MSKSKVIRHGLMFVGLAVGLWHGAQALEVISGAKAAGGHAPSGTPAGLLSALQAKAGTNPTAIDLAALRGVLPGAAPQTPSKPELVVFAADGKPLTHQEHQRLLKEAERLRPKVPSNPAPAAPRAR
ncbi:MAG: hypothetical protein SFZ24_02310 [Planctomycetota bacterium]|nr:hypothetical protein [Planctomycetota bacterium]